MAKVALVIVILAGITACGPQHPEACEAAKLSMKNLDGARESIFYDPALKKLTEDLYDQACSPIWQFWK